MCLDSLAAAQPGAPPFLRIPKEKLLADIQLQGAISDFHPIKDAIRAADCDALAVRPNLDDAYGDGNNYEVRLKQAPEDGLISNT
jgi:hypothetical protein